jgi:MFS family permease
VLFNDYRGLPKDAKYLIYSAALPFVAYGMFYTDLSFFLTSVQGLSIPFMGLIVSVMGASAFVASIPLGVIADKYGRKRHSKHNLAFFIRRICLDKTQTR